MALFTDKQLLIVGGVAAVGLYLAWRKLPALGDAVNPTNPENVFYTGVNGVGESVTGQTGWTLGGQIYGWLHPNEAAELGLTASAKTTDTISGG